MTAPLRVLVACEFSGTVRRAMQSMVLAVDDWRAIVADVLEACALAERPGQCPDDVGAA